LKFYFLDFETAVGKEKSENQNQIPKHENVIKNFVNVEIFHKNDKNQEDCLGWITIMEKAGKDLRTILKEEKIGIEERKKIAKGIFNGFRYLKMIGIGHFDRKMENILMLNGIPKIIDFGLVYETTGRIGYRKMGNTRRGSKFRNHGALCKFL
jgi:serine/threonine protein kinase